jgi:hypothetical protein
MVAGPVMLFALDMTGRPPQLAPIIDPPRNDNDHGRRGHPIEPTSHRPIPRRHGRIDVLLNDAGRAVRGVVEEVPGAAAEAMVDVNVFSRMFRPVAAVCDNAASEVVRRDEWRSARRGGLHGHRAVSRSG